MMAASGTNDDKRSGRRCMNALCEEGPTTPASRNGWPLRSGDFAILCDKCGSAYEQSIFCDVFHSNDSGWRECSSCAKRLHCGCAASRFLIELLDCGGVSCISCSRNPGDNPVNADEKPNGFSMLGVDDINESQSAAGNQLDGDRKLIPLEHSTEEICTRNWLQLQNDKTNGFLRHMKLEDNLTSAGDIEHTSFTTFNQASKPEICKVPAAAKDIYESPTHTSLSITLGPSLGNLNPFPGIVDEREQSKPSSPLQQGTRSRHLLPKPPKSALTTGLEANGGMASQMRVARPPAEGRGRNQLLPRYWPRITDQELQQLSGDSNSTIVPLFEKVLSASDAGRIGRLVLPKACAEAYFPPISQPEGLPLRIQDVKGKDWVFQFRFWPNNNSRMYVLEGVTPCIQSMQLQAGDTVTFSRMDPEGKLVMGFRKASNSGTLQDTQASAVSNGNLSSDRFFSGVFENLPIISGYSGLLQSLKGSADTHFSATSKILHSAAADGSWHKIERQEDMTKERLLPPSLLFPERKRTRNIGSKNKRLLFDSLDALELKLTWEEAQDLLRPPRSVKPSVVTIEDHDFEEYDEPPVFGKRSIFVARSIGAQEQWAQCDSCTKWRRLPVDVILPPKWTCQDNSWDQSRCSCSAPDELTPRELENLLRLYTDFKKRKLGITKQIQENESSGLDTLANAAILGDMGDPSGTAVATTTKHPRHRPGCSCIVCIQPPSGKGKHKPTCTCNVCMTVKRRFKTLMMRKKKRQSEREAEIAERNRLTWGPKDEIEVDSNSKLASSFPADPSENEVRPLNNELESRSPSNNLSNKLVDSSKGHIDLNCYPDREQDTTVGLTRTSMIGLLQVASLPLDTYLKQNGLTSLASEQQATSTSHLRAQAGESEGQRNEYSQVQAGESEGQRNESCQVPSTTAQEQESGGEENCETLPDHSENDPL